MSPMEPSPETVELETGAKPDAAVIWLHGLGADGHDFEPVAGELGLPRRLAIRFVFPHAPVRPVTINMGASMRAWYDIVALDGRREDATGIRASHQLLDGLIERECRRGIAPQRIVLAGFSQGGAIALHCGLRHHSRLAGIMALSTYLPLAGTIEVERNPANAGLPILMAHGQHDEMIAIARARDSRSILEALGYSLEWSEYPMGHSVCAEEIETIANWLGRIL